MKLSRKSDYALRALLHLAASRESGPVPVRELAEKNDIPRKFLEAIMRDLRELGLVESVAGKKGGYLLVLSPARISIGSILRHFDGHLEPFEADAAEIDQSSPEDPTRRVQRVLREIGAKVDELMNQTTLESVLAGRPILYEITSRHEFRHGDGI